MPWQVKNFRSGKRGKLHDLASYRKISYLNVSSKTSCGYEDAQGVSSYPPPGQTIPFSLCIRQLKGKKVN